MTLPPRATAWLLVSGLLLIVGCIAYRWRPVPITDVSLQKEGLVPRDVLVETERGPVRLRVESMAFPYISGSLREPGGLAEVELTTQSLEVVQLGARNQILSRSPITIDQARQDPSLVIGRHLRISGLTASFLLRDVRGFDFPWVEGTLVSGNGTIRVDLRRVTSLAVREVNGPATVVRVLGITAATVGAVALIVALTKESCPFVYVDRGTGWEFVGEAYAGAAFRSTQRDDLLPVPALAGTHSLRLRLRNEARETQYTDRAALVVVDHARSVRALSTFDGQVIFVGRPVAPTSALDRRGQDATALISEADQRLWETHAGTAAEMTDAQLEEELLAEFQAAGNGTPVLEIVGGNTTWLDLVFGRFFAAMGPRLAEYIEQGNHPSAGPRIQSWREREGVDLAVEVRTVDGWRRIALVPTVGPAALREIAVPLPLDAVTADGHVIVRVRGGLGFWRIDRMALSTRSPLEGEVHRIRPRAAVTDGVDELASILETDGRYNDLSEMNESLDVDFDLPSLPDGLTRTAFLHTNGYYNVHQPIQSRWLPATLVAIRDEPGALSRFGRDLARAYADKLAATPVVSIGRTR
jgi:hypothetical protein